MQWSASAKPDHGPHPIEADEHLPAGIIAPTAPPGDHR